MSVDNLFAQSACPMSDKLHDLPKCVRRRDVARCLFRSEIFKRQMHQRQYGRVRRVSSRPRDTWAQISAATLEPMAIIARLWVLIPFSGTCPQPAIARNGNAASWECLRWLSPDRTAINTMPAQRAQALRGTPNAGLVERARRTTPVLLMRTSTVVAELCDGAGAVRLADHQFNRG
jgi:hypothetical protein